MISLLGCLAVVVGLAGEPETHWSVSPVRTEFGAARSIDDFVIARLGEAGLRMSGEADRRTLIRRLYFDLIGLPPSPERVAEFVADSRPDAYGRLVDELLASPHHGERWARHWLDIAHYADTHGFERDKVRQHAWRWRDYVIDAFNADKPYDRFLREQIAGDVFAPDDPEAVIATGFLAAGPWDFVGNAETKSPILKRAARAGDLDDMLTQVITATMGITINCARCHDHKVDPITQEEYYRLAAVFAGVKRGDRDADPAKSKRVAAEREQLNKQLTELRARIARRSGDGLDLADMIGGGDGRGAGVKGRGIHIRNGNFVTPKLGYHRDIQANRLQKLEWPGDPKDARRFVQWVFVPDGRSEVFAAYKKTVSGVPPTSGFTWDAIRNGPLNAQKSTVIDGVDYAGKGHSILDLHANSGVTFDLLPVRKANGLRALRFTAAVGFGVGKGVEKTRADFSVFVGTELKFQRLKMRKDESAHVDIAIPGNVRTLTLMATDGGDGIGHDLLFLGDAKLLPDDGPAELAKTNADELKSLRDKARELERQIAALPEPGKVYGVIADKDPPVIRVQVRGDPEMPAQEVEPGTFAWVNHCATKFAGNEQPEGERRRALAEWITHPDNPLTARVIVNRLWHHHFGQGIVTTPSDFGLGGDQPSHPGLLDWLARELIANGWSLKHMHKLIVSSRAWRQRSDVSDETATTIDAGNRLMWRQNVRRLDAESMRDAILSVAGTLNDKRGGPGFRDFDYTEAYAPIYRYVTPDRPELWRRSIYRFIVRTTPHQFLTTLDCPDAANLTPKRVQTTTALQALTLSNNEFMLLQARKLAEHCGSVSDDEAVDHVFARCFQRQPSRQERDAAKILIAEEGLFALCRALFNANEFVYLD